MTITLYSVETPSQVVYLGVYTHSHIDICKNENGAGVGGRGALPHACRHHAVRGAVDSDLAEACLEQPLLHPLEELAARFRRWVADVVVEYAVGAQRATERGVQRHLLRVRVRVRDGVGVGVGVGVRWGWGWG